MADIINPSWLTRTESLIGGEAVKRLAESSVLLFGCGGVGGYVAEALVRGGIGRLTIVDHDRVAESNINRQIIADTVSIGQEKAVLIAERAKRINPNIEVCPLCEFADGSNTAKIIADAHPDYICDAIDTVTSKLLIIEESKKSGIAVISSMGTGNKLDPTRFKIADISKTSVCPLARVMRHELAQRNIKDVDVLYSDEPPIKTGMRTPASISYVPAAAGLIIGGYIIRKIVNLNQ